MCRQVVEVRKHFTNFMISINLLTERTLPVCLVNAHVYKYVNLPYMSVTNQIELDSRKHFSFFCNDQSHGPANDVNCKVETPPRYFFCGSFIFFCLVLLCLRVRLFYVPCGHLRRKG